MPTISHLMVSGMVQTEIRGVPCLFPGVLIRLVLSIPSFRDTHGVHPVQAGIKVRVATVVLQVVMFQKLVMLFSSTMQKKAGLPIPVLSSVVQNQTSLRLKETPAIYSLGDSSIDGYGDNNGTPIYESTPAVTDADIEIKMKEFFHDLLVPFGVDVNITDSILMNGYSIPTGDPNITLTARIARDMVFGSGNLKATVENGEFQLATDLTDTLSVAFGSIDPTKAQTIKSLMDGITISIDSGDCEVSYSFTVQQIEITVRFLTEIEVIYGQNYEIGVEYKLTYKSPSDPASPEAEIYSQNYNNNITIRDTIAEHPGEVSVVIILLSLIFYWLLGPVGAVPFFARLVEEIPQFGW